MLASSKIQKPAAQIEPAKKAAKLKADNEAKKARPAWPQPQTPTSLIETPLAPEPERIGKPHRYQGPPAAQDEPAKKRKKRRTQLPGTTWVPDPLVAKRYGINGRTLRRWDEDPTLGFPPVIIINTRRYRELTALEDWERRTAARARSTKAKWIEEHSTMGAA
jgi:hypothetical protein